MQNSYHFDPKKYEKELIGIFDELVNLLPDIDDNKVAKVLKQFPKGKSDLFRKDELISGLEYIIDHSDDDSKQHYSQLLDKIKLKPMRTESGVTTVTVLTKPFACPGECIFCPNDVRMPKSYIATEPGAQRALQNRFSPYLQVWNRLQALKNIGHPTEKIELLVLGGTWSYYPEKYQIWFISECFRAMNDFSQEKTNTKLKNKNDVDYDLGIKSQTSNAIRYEIDSSGFKSEGEKIKIRQYLESDWNNELRNKVGDLPYNKLILTEEFQKEFSQFICSEDSALPVNEAWPELFRLQNDNSTSDSRCVGLVLETRPDSIHPREVLRLRKLGATKIQLGIQTLNDEVSRLNKRGEGMKETSAAFEILRAAGFKIHAHMMPNLYGATPEIDKEVYKNLFTLLAYKPDEVKIYPCSVIKNTELYDLYESGKFRPYETAELVDIIAYMIEQTPEYCRLTRIIRDIPSTEIEAGNKTTNLREVVEWKLKNENRANPNIRAREIRDKKVGMEDLSLDIQQYETSNTTEYFLQYITEERRIAGFLRLSLPKITNNKLKIKNIFNKIWGNELEPISVKSEITSELDNCAIIREVHVYGPSLELKKDSEGQAQHLGLGTKLIEKAKEITKKNNFSKLAVISAIGTREYYKKRNFHLENFYQIAKI